MAAPPRRLVATAVASLVCGIGTATYAAPIIVHESLEFFFESGGTHATNCLGLGCPAVSFTVGPISGDVLWDLQEKVLQDPVTQTTSFTYTLFNEILSPPITSLVLSSAGLQGAGVAPAGWTFVQSASAWRWFTSDQALAIQPGLFLAGFNVELPGMVPVGFAPASIGLAGGESLSSSNWAATSPVPEPSSVLLVGTALLGFYRRWGSRHRR